MLDFAIVVEKRDADRRQQCRAEQQEQDAERADDDGESHFGTLRSAANCGWTLATALHYASGCADGISTPAILRSMPSPHGAMLRALGARAQVSPSRNVTRAAELHQPTARCT